MAEGDKNDRLSAIKGGQRVGNLFKQEDDERLANLLDNNASKKKPTDQSLTVDQDMQDLNELKVVTKGRNKVLESLNNVQDTDKKEKLGKMAARRNLQKTQSAFSSNAYNSSAQNNLTEQERIAQEMMEDELRRDKVPGSENNTRRIKNNTKRNTKGSVKPKLDPTSNPSLSDNNSVSSTDTNITPVDSTPNTPSIKPEADLTVEEKNAAKGVVDEISRLLERYKTGLGNGFDSLSKGINPSASLSFAKLRAMMQDAANNALKAINTSQLSDDVKKNLTEGLNSISSAAAKLTPNLKSSGRDKILSNMFATFTNSMKGVISNLSSSKGTSDINIDRVSQGGKEVPNALAETYVEGVISKEINSVAVAGQGAEENLTVDEKEAVIKFCDGMNELLEKDGLGLGKDFASLSMEIKSNEHLNISRLSGMMGKAFNGTLTSIEQSNLELEMKGLHTSGLNEISRSISKVLTFCNMKNALYRYNLGDLQTSGEDKILSHVFDDLITKVTKFYKPTISRGGVTEFDIQFIHPDNMILNRLLISIGRNISDFQKAAGLGFTGLGINIDSNLSVGSFIEQMIDASKTAREAMSQVRANIPNGISNLIDTIDKSVVIIKGNSYNADEINIESVSGINEANPEQEENLTVDEKNAAKGFFDKISELLNQYKPNLGASFASLSQRINPSAPLSFSNLRQMIKNTRSATSENINKSELTADKKNNLNLGLTNIVKNTLNALRLEYMVINLGKLNPQLKPQLKPSGRDKILYKMFTDLTKKVEEVISKFSKTEVINIDSDIKLETSYINSLVAMLDSTGSSINSAAKSGGEAFRRAADSIKKGGEVTIKYAADQISQASRTSGQVLSQAVNSAGNSLNKAGQQVSKAATSAGAAVSTGLSTAASAGKRRGKAVLSGLYNLPGAMKEFLENLDKKANSFIDDTYLAHYGMDSHDYKKGREELKEKEENNGPTTQADSNPNLKNNDQVVSPDNQKINTTQTAQNNDQLSSSSKPKKESQGIDVATTQAGNNANSQRNDQVSRIQNAADSINEDDINNIKNMPEYRRSSQSYDPVLNRLDAIERKLDETRYSQQVHDEDRWMSDGMRAGLAIALLLLLFISPGLAIAIGSGVAVSYGLTKHAFKQPNKQPIAPQENDKANNNRGISNYFQRKSVKAPDTPKTQDKDAGKGI